MTSTDLTPGQLIDISQTVSEETAVWPGDTPFSLSWAMKLSPGCPCNVATINMSVHVGTHADAPYHFLAEGKKPAEVDLTRYLGRCRVLHTQTDDRVCAADLEGLDLDGIERILFRTPRPTKAESWRDDFAYLGVDAAELLRDGGVKLVGIDTPSMDPMTSKTMDAHKTLCAADIALLENLDLTAVPEGDYELIALPLKLRDADSSPVRAVLRVLE